MPGTRAEFKAEYVERFRLARVQLNLTQQELADELGVSRATVANWESGSRFPSASMRRRIDRLFQLVEQRAAAAG